MKLADAFVDLTVNRAQFDAGLRLAIAQLNTLKGLGTVDLKMNRGAATANLSLLRQQLDALKAASTINLKVNRTGGFGGIGGGGGRGGVGAVGGLMQGLGLAGFATSPGQMVGQMIGGGLKDAVTHAMELEATFTGLQRVSGESAANVDRFKKTIFEIGKTQAGVSIKDLTDISMAGAKAGITDKEGLGGLETFTRGMAKVRNSVQGIGTEQLADNMVRMLNLFHKGTDYVQSFGSVLARMDNISTSSAGDILDMSKSLSGTFASLGMGIPQVMAFSSVLSDVGLTNQQGASSFSQILRMLASQSEKMAEKIGVPIDVFQEKVRTDAMGALGMLIQRFREINEVDPIKAQEFIAGLGFRGVKTAGALQQLSSIFEQVQERTQMAIEEETTLGSLQAANNLNSTTAISNILMLKNSFEELGDTIGSKVVPHLTEMSKTALMMVNGMTGSKAGGPANITWSESMERLRLITQDPLKMIPGHQTRIAEINAKQEAYNAYQSGKDLGAGASTAEDRIANLEKSRAGASPEEAAKIDAAIAKIKDGESIAKGVKQGWADAAKMGAPAPGAAGQGNAPGRGSLFGKLPGVADEDAAKFLTRPTAAEMKGDTEGDSRLKRLAGFVQEKQDRVEFGMPKKQFQSQMFSGGDDFAQHMVKEALSDKEDVSKQALEVHKESKKVLDKISSTLLEGTGIRPLTNPVAIMRGGASPP